MILHETPAAFVLSEVPPHISLRLKRIFRHIKPYVTDHFVFPKTPPIAADIEWFLSRYPAKVDAESLRPLIEENARREAELLRISAPDYTPRPVELVDGHELRNYQARAVDLLSSSQRFLLGDDLGLGKTLVAIGAIAHVAKRPAVIVVQTHLPKQWGAQLRKFLGTELRIHNVKGTRPYELPPADVYIWKYSCLAGWVDIFKTLSPRLVAFDEVQELRRSESAKHKAGLQLSEAAEFVIGLTATPIYNKGFEIFNVMNLLSPGCLGSDYEFRTEWCSFGDIVHDPVALGTYLRSAGLFLRRKRDEVGRELPQVNRVIHTVDHDKARLADFEDIAKELAETVLTGEFTERGQAARELDMRMRMETGLAKARYVARYVRVLLENGEPVVLAGWHRDVYEIWYEELKSFNPLFYTGTESGTKKAKNADAFMSGETNLLIYSLRSGAGLDGLQERGSIVVFGELDWSPKVHEQLIGRLNRDGQENQVTAIYLVSDGGSDPPMIDLLGLKASQSKGIVDLGISERVQRDASRIQKLAKQLLGESHAA